ncbi:MAG: M4 family metallopeptidase [Pseudonocardia sp.]
MPCSTRHPLACFVPPDLLRDVIVQGDAADRQAALDSLLIDSAIRTMRAENAARTLASLQRLCAGSGKSQRFIHDQRHGSSMTPGPVIRAEGQPVVADATVNQAYDGFGDTYRFYWEVLQRDSIDDQGMPIHGLMHFDNSYNNAFWDGAGHMFFGDGDGRLFLDFTKGTDVIGHELTHGVTQYTANLVYSGESGALNESISDVFGSMIKQYALGQTVDQADWLIGADVVGPELEHALRSMKEPGTANKYDHQPSDMDGYVVTIRDHGGVHTNSGIPNRAFYLAAAGIGGKSWEKAGSIWYAALNDATLTPNTRFKGFAHATIQAAKSAYGPTSAPAKAVTDAWRTVKVL